MNFDYEMVYDGESVRVTGSISKYRPATGPSMAHAGGDPAEGGEIEDFQVFDESGKELDDDDGAILRALEDDIIERASEAAEDAAADAAEARADERADR